MPEGSSKAPPSSGGSARGPRRTLPSSRRTRRGRARRRPPRGALGSPARGCRRTAGAPPRPASSPRAWPWRSPPGRASSSRESPAVRACSTAFSAASTGPVVATGAEQRPVDEDAAAGRARARRAHPRRRGSRARGRLEVGHEKRRARLGIGAQDAELRTELQASEAHRAGASWRDSQSYTARARIQLPDAAAERPPALDTEREDRLVLLRSSDTARSKQARGRAVVAGVSSAADRRRPSSWHRTGGDRSSVAWSRRPSSRPGSARPRRDEIPDELGADRPGALEQRWRAARAGSARRSFGMPRTRRRLISA